MVDELEQFQQDLLESVRQMKAGEAARVTPSRSLRRRNQASRHQALLDWETGLPLSQAVQCAEKRCSCNYTFLWARHNYCQFIIWHKSGNFSVLVRSCAFWEKGVWQLDRRVRRRDSISTEGETRLKI